GRPPSLRGVRPGGPAPVGAVFAGLFERCAAQAADDRAVFDLRGRELDAAWLGQARVLDWRLPSVPLGGFARAIVVLVPDAVCAAGPGRAGQVDQEREAGRINSGGHLGPGVVGGLPVQGAMRPAGDLVRHVWAAQAQFGCEGDEPLVVVAVPGGWFLAADYPPFGPVMAAQLITLRGALLVRPGPGHDHHIGHVRVLVLDRGPGVFAGGDDPASVLLDGPGVRHGGMPFL